MTEIDAKKHAEALAAAIKESTDRCIGEKTLNADLELTGFRAGTNRKDL